MDWSNPDPANIDYIMAIRQAIVERAILTGYTVPAALFRLSPYVPLNTDVLTAFRDAIYSLAANFVDLSFTDYQTDGSDFPKKHDYGTLILSDDCRICTLPSKGAMLEHLGAFLLAAKNIIEVRFIQSASPVMVKSQVPTVAMPANVEKPRKNVSSEFKRS